MLLKIKLFMLTGLLFLVLNFSVTAYAATCDGYCDISWGLTSTQIDEALKSQGFTLKENPGQRQYKGYLGGLACTVYNPTGTQVDIVFQTTAVCQQLVDILTTKYGSPKVANQSGYTLRSDGTIDKEDGYDTVMIYFWMVKDANGNEVDITLKSNYWPTLRNDPQDHLSLNYTNKGLANAANPVNYKQF